MNDPSYYAASLYLDRTNAENALKFPRNGWKMATGTVCSEGGPMNRNNRTGHVDWWLYEGKEINEFSTCEENNHAR